MGNFWKKWNAAFYIELWFSVTKQEQENTALVFTSSITFFPNQSAGQGIDCYINTTCWSLQDD